MVAGVNALEATYNTVYTYGSIANVLCKLIILHYHTFLIWAVLTFPLTLFVFSLHLAIFLR